MSKMYVVTSCSNDVYGIESMWSSKEDAEKHCMFLNAGSWYGDAEVEEYPLDAPVPERMNEMMTGFKARQCFSDSGDNVDTANVEFRKAMWHPNQSRVKIVGDHNLYVFGESKEECLKTLLDAVAEYKANRAGIVL